MTLTDIEFKNETYFHLNRVIDLAMRGDEDWHGQGAKVNELIDQYIKERSEKDTEYVLKIQHLDECNGRQCQTIESQTVELQDLNCRNENQARIIKDVKARSSSSLQGMGEEIKGLKGKLKGLEFTEGQANKLAGCRGREIKRLRDELCDLNAELEEVRRRDRIKLNSLRNKNREIKDLKGEIDRQAYLLKVSNPELIRQKDTIHALNQDTIAKNKEARNLRKQITTFGVEIGNLEATVQTKDGEIKKLKECLVNCHKDMDTKAAHIEKLRRNAVDAGEADRKRIVEEITSGYFGTATTNGDRISELANVVRSYVDPIRSIAAECSIQRLECYARQQELLVLERDITISNHKDSINRRGDEIERCNTVIAELKVKNAKDFKEQQRKLTEGSLSDRLAASHEVADEFLSHYDIVEDLETQILELTHNKNSLSAVIERRDEQIKLLKKEDNASCIELVRRYDVITDLENKAIDHRKEKSKLITFNKEANALNVKWAQQNVGLKKVIATLMVNIMKGL